VVLEVENLGEARAGERLFIPAPVRSLCPKQEIDAGLNLLGLRFPGGQRPRSAQAVCEAVGVPLPAKLGSS